MVTVYPYLWTLDTFLRTTNSCELTSQFLMVSLCFTSWMLLHLVLSFRHEHGLRTLAELSWGLPRAIISDRDRKFVSEVWKEIFRLHKVDLMYSTAWHPQTDGMSERSNQTAEIALRYYIASLENDKLWPTVLPRMTAALNNSTKYSSTTLAPTQVLYGFTTREVHGRNFASSREEGSDDRGVSLFAEAIRLLGLLRMLGMGRLVRLKRLRIR